MVQPRMISICGLFRLQFWDQNAKINFLPWCVELSILSYCLILFLSHTLIYFLKPSPQCFCTRKHALLSFIWSWIDPIHWKYCFSPAHSIEGGYSCTGMYSRIVCQNGQFNQQILLMYNFSPHTSQDSSKGSMKPFNDVGGCIILRSCSIVRRILNSVNISFHSELTNSNLLSECILWDNLCTAKCSPTNVPTQSQCSLPCWV